MVESEEMMTTILPPPSATLPDLTMIPWPLALEGPAILALLGAMAVLLAALGSKPAGRKPAWMRSRPRLREAM